MGCLTGRSFSASCQVFPVFKKKKHTWLYIIIVCAHMCITAHVWRSEDSMEESLLSFLRVAPESKLRSSGWAAGVLTHCGISLAPGASGSLYILP